MFGGGGKGGGKDPAALMRMLRQMQGRGCEGRADESGKLLVDFFRGGQDIEGRTLAQMREWDFEHMEMVHDYVQWWFPTDEESMFNMDAPILTAESIQAFKDDEALRKELKTNLMGFCAFLGLECTEEAGKPKIVKAAHFNERVRNCWSSMMGGNHNWLRITRVIRCLGRCSMPDEQAALMVCLETIAGDNSVRVQSSLPHWRKAATLGSETHNLGIKP